VPEPPSHSFDAQAAERGRLLFAGQADCARCHVAPLYAEPGFPMHTGAEIGIDEFQARRGPYDRCRTTPLHGLFAKSTGGYYHDGRFATLADVVEHYDQHFQLGLSTLDKHDLVEFLKSL
jgi:cytochrome c peroxidase